MRRVLPLLTATACLGALSACKFVDEGPPPAGMPSVDGAPRLTHPVERGPLPPDPILAAVQSLATRVASQTSGSIGVLPLVTFDVRDNEASVSELGVRLADETATRVTESGFVGEVLGTNAMSVRLAEEQVDKVALHTLAQVSEEGDRLGVDTVVFGTIRRDYAVGPGKHDLLSFDWSAFDVSSRSVIASEKLTVRSDQLETEEHWTWLDRASLWSPGGKFPVPAQARSLDREIAAKTTLLARRILARVPSTEGDVYLPPTDTASLVRSISRLRGVQAAYAAELAARTEAASTSGQPLDLDRPFVLDGNEVTGLSGARAYLESLRETIFASDAARFGEAISASLAEALLAKLPGAARLVDLGATKWSDTQLVEAEMAQGGLVRSLLAREALKESGATLAIAPRLERFGVNHVLRVEAIALDEGRLVASTHVRLDPRFRAEIEAELQAPEIGGVLPSGTGASAGSGASWDDVFRRVASGVVRVTGSNGVTGTGFVVSQAGAILTNAHVVKGIGDASPSVVLADGSAGPYEILDRNDFWDIAVLRVGGLPQGIHVFRFADRPSIEVGEDVAVLGHPTGSRGWVLTAGNLSSLSEPVPSDLGERPSYLYTARTAKGQSGSPVLDRAGRIVAVDSHELAAAYVPRGGAPGLAGFAVGSPGPEVHRILVERGVLAR